MFFKEKCNVYSSNLDSYIEHTRNGELKYLPLIFCVFAENSSPHKWKAAQFLNEVLNSFSPDELYKTDIQMRQTTSMEWSIDWSSLRVEHFITRQMEEDEKRAVFIFASFNPNGYIREQAIHALARYEGSLPLILLRCNDWVYQVRQTALQLLSERLSNAGDKEVVDALPFMEKLRRSGRCEYDHVLLCMVRCFVLNESLVKKGLNSRDMRARRFCISILNQLPEGEKEYLIAHIRCEKEPFLRKMIYQILLRADVNAMELSKQFLSDKYPPNRILALQTLREHESDAAFQASEKMLLDKNAQVRATARSIVLESESGFDIRRRYVDGLYTNTVVCICGLGEVGYPEDSRLIETFLSDNRVSIVRVAMTALMRLNPSAFIGRITELLLSEQAGIVKTAALLLKKNGGYDFGRILEIQKNVSKDNAKVKCATLLFLDTKWKSLIYTLMLMDSDCEALEIACQTQIDKWISRYNLSYAVASQEDKETIKKLLVEKQTCLKPGTAKVLSFLCK